MLKIIPIYAHAGLVGFESPAAEYKELGLDLDALLIEHPSATYIALANGDSMIGDGIFSGDLLIISRAATVKDFDIIVANLNGTFVCKRLDKNARSLLSSNGDAKPFRINESDVFQIEGVVTRSIRLHRPLLGLM